MSKEYIGSGKKHAEYDVVKVTIDVEKAREHIFEYEGKKYLSFDVAAKREIDQYGKSHSVSVWVPENQDGGNGQGQPENQAPETFSDDGIPF